MTTQQVPRPASSSADAVPRLSASSSVDSFLSWISAPSTGGPPKQRKSGSSLQPASGSPASPPVSSLPSVPSASQPSSSPFDASPRTRTTSYGRKTEGSTFILADATRLRELSKSPLEEMGLPLFAISSSPQTPNLTVSESPSRASKKTTSRVKKSTETRPDVAGVSAVASEPVHA